MSQDWKRLAEAIRAARKACGWTQHDLADAAGIGFSTVQRVEAGKPYARRPAVLVHVERALRWAPGSSEAILGGGDPMPAEQERGSGVVAEAFAAAGLPLPRVVRHELEHGELLDTAVLRFGSGRGSIVVIAKTDADEAQVGEDLREWSRVERALRGIVDNAQNDK